MRPVVQVAVAKAVRAVVSQGLLTWDEAMAKLKTVDWIISSPPFSAVWQLTPSARAQGKMATGKDATDLLFALLVVHLAPISKAQVDRAVASYRSVKGSKYPIAKETLQVGIVAAPSTPPVTTPDDHVDISAVAADSEEEASGESDDAEK